jgi:hypothetical protein
VQWQGEVAYYQTNIEVPRPQEPEKQPIKVVTKPPLKLVEKPTEKKKDELKILPISAEAVPEQMGKMIIRNKIVPMVAETVNKGECPFRDPIEAGLFSI